MTDPHEPLEYEPQDPDEPREPARDEQRGGGRGLMWALLALVAALAIALALVLLVGGDDEDNGPATPTTTEEPAITLTEDPTESETTTEATTEPETTTEEPPAPEETEPPEAAEPGAGDGTSDAQSPGAPPNADNALRYEIATGGAPADVTYVLPGGQTESEQGVSSRWYRDVTFNDRAAAAGARVVVRNTGGGEAYCRIFWEGEMVSEDRVPGPNAEATCELLA